MIACCGLTLSFLAEMTRSSFGHSCTVYPILKIQAEPSARWKMKTNQFFSVKLFLFSIDVLQFL
jgi:hypothetical protein